MAKRGRKRTFSQSKENAPREPPNKIINREDIHLEVKDWMPTAAVQFFHSGNFEKIVKSLTLVDGNAVLVGPFRKLREESDATGVELIMLDREETDLPEMQTFLKCTHGRYGFWRDTPNEKHPVIVFIDLKTIPELSVVGNKAEHAIHAFCQRCSNRTDNSTKNKSTIAKLLELLGDNIEEEVAQVIKNRRKKTIQGVSGPGMLLNNPHGRSGYRDFSKSPHVPKIENFLRCLGSIAIKEQETKVISLIEPLMNEIMVCNDEGDYGNGLELGRFLFLANRKSMADEMMKALGIAYKLLGRSDFLKILKLTMELRDQ